MPAPSRWPYLEWYGDVPAPSGLTDEEKIRALMGGRPMLPVEYTPGPESPRRDMTWAEFDALHEQRRAGMQPQIAPFSKTDFLAEPLFSFLGEADIDKYVPFGLLGMAVAGKGKGALTAEQKAAAKAARAEAKAAENAAKLERARTLAQLANLGDTATVAVPESRIIGPTPPRIILPGQAPSILKGPTARAVLEGSARDVAEGNQFPLFRAENPNAGRTLFDLTTAGPAIPERGQFALPRIVPKRGMSERLEDALANPKVGRVLRQAVRQGMEDMPETWYGTSPLYREFQRIYGDYAQPAYEQLISMVAATSPRNPVPQNIKAASYYNWLWRQGQPFEVPPKGSGYGNIAQILHRDNALDFLAGEYDVLNKPKPPSYRENLLGNMFPVTADTHNVRLLGIASEDPRWLASTVQVPKLDEAGKVMRDKEGEIIYDYLKPRQMYETGELTMKEALNRPGFWESAPSETTEYGPYESWQQKQARKMGITPARWQEAMWVGGGKKTGLVSPPEPFLATLAARINYTAAQLGTSPQKILDLFIQGKIPLMSLGAGMAVMSQQEPERPAQ